MPTTLRQLFSMVRSSANARGDNKPQALAERMRAATGPMPGSSLQRLVILARKQLNLPDASIHLRQIQANLGHSSPTITALYTHLTSLCQTQHQKLLDDFMSDL